MTLWRRMIAWARGGDEQAVPVVRFATVGAALLNLVQVGRFLYSAGRDASSSSWVWMLCAALAFVPLETFLLVAAIRNVRPRLAPLVLAGVAVPIIALLPLSAYDWPLMLSVLIGLVLIYFRPPVSFVLAALVLALVAVSVLTISRTPAGLAESWRLKRQFLVIDLVDTVWAGVALAVVVWLTRSVRELDAARRQLAARAVIIERQRIDEEVSRTLGAALETIAARGELAAALARTTPELAAGELAEITARSRATLAEARGMLTRYREVSALAELRAAVTLLSAAGVTASLVLPGTDLPPELPASVRLALRAAVARALTESELRDCVLTVAVGGGGDGDLTLCLARAGAGPPARRGLPVWSDVA